MEAVALLFPAKGFSVTFVAESHNHCRQSQMEGREMSSLTHLGATVVDGELRLDDRVDLPNASRVQVTIRSMPLAKKIAEQTESPWDSLMRFLRDHPLNSGGLKYTREELHEGR
jgi:hypothetical protein